MDLHRWRESLTPRNFTLFLYVWLMVGFASGTLVLLGPARWLTALARRLGAGQRGEDLAMWALIALFVAASFLAAIWLTRFVCAYRARAHKLGVMLLVTGAAAVALWGWMNPALYAEAAGGGGSEDVVAMDSGARFVFGAYPDRSRLEELKRQGVAGVISLQHPAVVPFEPEGIERGREWTSELGIRFIHAPMLPWVSDNESSLEKIRTIAREETGLFYVHCGLGRDRVNVVQQVLKGMGARDLRAEETVDALTWADREAEGLGNMERGAPIRLDEDVWMVPFPNEHEMFGHMLGGQVAHAALLLDPADSVQAAWLEEAGRRFDDYGLSWSSIAVGGDAGATAERAAAAADTLPRPLTLVVPATPPERDTATAAAVRRVWRGPR